MSRKTTSWHSQGGFTIIEVLVASVVLLSGVLGTVTMLDAANATGTTTKGRDQSVGLARELIEAARSIPYAQLVPSSIVANVQAKPGLGNANAGPGWTIQRRGVTYGVSMGVCSVDDPSDGFGTEDPDYACASNSGAPSIACAQLLGHTGSVAGDGAVVSQNSGTLAGQRAIGDCGLDLNLDGRVDDLTQADVSACGGGACQNTPIGSDASPDDYKRIVVLVTWRTRQTGTYTLQSTLVVNPGQSSGPTVSSLALGAGFSSTVITDPTVQSVSFNASTDSNAVSMQWLLNGTPQGSAANSGGTWSFNWPIGTPGSGSEVLDGNYTVGVTPFDTNGNAGAGRSMTVTLNRRMPYAPVNLAGGHDSSLVDLQWSPNKEGDVLGYRAYRVAGGGQPDVLVCSTANSRTVACQDTNPPGAASIPYYVVALDRDANGNVREGDHSATLTVTTSNQAPNPATGLQASSSNGNTVLLWTPPSPADGDGDQLDFYRIYRDGQAVSNRYDTAPGNASSYTDTATGGVAHTYYVTAVDPQLAESSAAGPVTR